MENSPLNRQDMERIDACVDLMLLGQYDAAAAQLRGHADPLINKLEELCRLLDATGAYLRRIARGHILDTRFPQSQTLKQFHQNLQLLLHRMKSFARGDYAELYEEMGDFSDYYNGMVIHMRRKEAQAALSRQYDAPTHLFGRKAFLEHIEARMKAEPKKMGVLLAVAFDTLPDIVALHGRDTGDEYMGAAARLLCDMGKWDDLCGRISEDELALYRQEDAPVEAMLASLQAMVSEFCRQFVEIEGRQHPFKVTCGAVCRHEDCTSSDMLLENALATVRSLSYAKRRRPPSRGGAGIFHK